MSRQKKPDAKQRGLFEPRNVLRTYLKRMVIQPFSYTNSRGRVVWVVGSLRMKGLLHVIESHCGYKPGEEDPGCFLKLQTIAQEMGCMPRKEGRTIEDVDTATATRAIAECEQAGLLTVERSFFKDRASRYRIEWWKVKQVILDNPATEHLINQTDPMRSEPKQEPKPVAEEALPVDDSEVTSNQFADETTHGKLRLTHGNLPFTHGKLQLTHGNLPLADDAITTSSRTRGLNQCINHERNLNKNHDALERQQLDNGTPRHYDGNEYSGYAGWPYKLEREHLQDVFKVQLFWEHALAKGFGGVKVTDRINFYRLVYCAMQPRINRPGGYLTATLKKIEQRETAWPTDVASERYAIQATSKVDITKEHIKSGKLTRDAERLLGMYRQTLNKDSGR